MNFKISKPWYFENSRIPKLLSVIAPINISAITLGPFVFSKDEMSEQTKNHEYIHWQQYIETGIIGFIILYFVYYIIGLIKYRSGTIAYVQIPFEQEAYENDKNIFYGLNRKRYNWIKRKI